MLTRPSHVKQTVTASDQFSDCSNKKKSMLYCSFLLLIETQFGMKMQQQISIHILPFYKQKLLRNLHFTDISEYLKQIMFQKFSKLINLARENTAELLFKSKFSYIRPKKKVTLKDPFQYQEQKITQSAEKGKKKYGYLQFGMYGLVVACCFAGIPLYRVFCQHVGLVGNYEKKTYEFKDDKVRNLKKYIVKFEGQPEPGINWEFEPIQKQVIIGPSETAIVFYRLYNKEDKPIVGFSTYNIAPEEAAIYFSKIQCFCFNQQMVNPKEELLLPIFFYLEPELADDPDVGRIREIIVHYDFIKSAKQNLAEFAQEELRKVEQNKKKLKEIRAKKKNMTIEQYDQYLQEQEIKQQEKLHKQLDSGINAVRADGTINTDLLDAISTERIDHSKTVDKKVAAAVA